VNIISWQLENLLSLQKRIETTMEVSAVKKNKKAKSSSFFEIEDKTVEAQLLIAYLKSLSFVKFLDEDNLPVSENVPNKTTLKAMKDAEMGRTYKGAETVKDLMDYLKS